MTTLIMTLVKKLIMAWNNLKSYIAGLITTNGTNDITGAILEGVLAYIVDAFGAYGVFGGIATPATNPGTIDGKVFYILVGNGTYTNFGGAVVSDGKLRIASYDGGWTISTFDVFTATQITALLAALDADITANASDITTLENTVADFITKTPLVQYTYSDVTTGGNPGKNTVAFDNENISESTIMYISKNASATDDSGYYISNLGAGDIIRLSLPNGDCFGAFYISSIVSQTGYYEVNIGGHLAIGTYFNDGIIVGLSFITRGLLVHITSDDLAAITGAASPSASNPFATIDDVSVTLTDDEKAAIHEANSPDASNPFLTQNDMPFTEAQIQAITNATGTPSQTNPFATIENVISYWYRRYWYRSHVYINATLPAGLEYSLDSATMAYNFNLAASPSTGYYYKFYVDFVSDVNTITINGNGNNINGASIYVLKGRDKYRKYEIVYSSIKGEWVLTDITPGNNMVIITDSYDEEVLLTGRSYSLDATADSFTVKLNPSPLAGERYTFFVNYASDTNTITIDGNGQTIGNSTELTVDDSYNKYKIELIYNDDTLVWTPFISN